MCSKWFHQLGNYLVPNFRGAGGHTQWGYCNQSEHFELAEPHLEAVHSGLRHLVRLLAAVVHLGSRGQRRAAGDGRRDAVDDAITLGGRRKSQTQLRDHFVTRRQVHLARASLLLQLLDPLLEGNIDTLRGSDEGCLAAKACWRKRASLFSDPTHLFEDGGLRLGVHDKFDVALDGGDGMLELLRHRPVRVRQTTNRLVELQCARKADAKLQQSRTETRAILHSRCFRWLRNLCPLHRKVAEPKTGGDLYGCGKRTDEKSCLVQ